MAPLVPQWIQSMETTEPNFDEDYCARCGDHRDDCLCLDGFLSENEDDFLDDESDEEEDDE